MTEQQQLRFDAPEDDPVTAYLASGLTSLNDDQIALVELVSSLVASYCSEAGVMVHQPVMYTHPRDHVDLTDQTVHAQDFGSAIDSDVIIAIGDFASWGAGKELAWAERLRTPVLMLIRRGRTMSRLVTGTSGDIFMADWRYSDDIWEAWTQYFTQRRAQLEAHRRTRAARRLTWTPTLLQIRAAYDGLGGSDRNEVAGIAHLSLRRMDEILSTPGALAVPSWLWRDSATYSLVSEGFLAPDA